MTGWLDGVVAAALITGGTLGARWAGWRWHGWRLRRVHAQHAGPVEAQDAEDTYDRAFYGSMSLDDERRTLWPFPRLEGDYLPQPPPGMFLPAEPDWRTQTMAELGALADPGPGPSSLVPGPDQRLCGPEQPHEKPAGTESAGSGQPYDVFDQFYRDTRALERLAHTGDIYGARLDLGPRAAAVLERYEQRRQERWALA